MTERKIELYNGAVETAARCLLVLEELRPSPLRIDELRMAELFVVFGNDIGAPFTLHNAIPGRMQAYVFREPRVVAGVGLLRELGLVEIDGAGGDSEIWSTGREEVTHHLGSCAYLSRMRENARWMARRLAEAGRAGLEQEMSSRMEALAGDPLLMPSEMRQRFIDLRTNYELDIERMHGLNEAAVVLSFVAPPGLAAWLDDTAEAALREIAAVRSKLSGLADVLAEMED